MITKKDIRLVYRVRQNQHGEPLFVAGDGNEIFANDRVEWDEPGRVFPTGGIVSRDSILHVSCYNQILDKWKWRHFPIV